MWAVARFFSKYASIQELGKFPNEIQKHLTVLGNIETYKSYMGVKPVTTLELLCKASKRKINLDSVRWQNYPEIKTLLETMPKYIPSYSLENVLAIVKSATKLLIFDENLWKALEQSVISNISTIRDRQLYDIVSCFSRYKKTSNLLWTELENVLINDICPKHNLQAVVLAQIISIYHKLDLLNPKLLGVLEQQILRVYLSFDGTDTSRILSIYCAHSIGDEEFIRCMCKQVKLSVSTMDWYSSTVALNCLIRLGRGDQVDPIERHVFLMSSRLSFQLIASIFYTYAKHIPIPLKNNTPRRKFIMDLCEVLLENPELVRKEENINTLLQVLHAMAIGKIFEFGGLWRMIGEKLEGKGKLQHRDDIEKFEKVKKVLEENGQSNLLNAQS